ncbi:C45 family autoproteolytic acyltransferase/hydolase [Salirhabdus salicampi]|uniref:C45 family autoproteolytic acyltransferase/hydolase n=1 Tax=Salirhabdus salicampi TaxID=476102 RepID=UPI0020C4FD5B|nr:C45 family peptidase [Salirhabdus salicampi]MCP8615627.1 C45 family autoproteolytic acyltransferase/hydrolase [Salirhabdus salicampi]
MKRVFTDVIQFRGTHYDFGVYQGKLLLNSFLLKNRERQWKVRKPLFKIDIEETKQMFQRFAPSIWEELLGLQTALQWPMKRVLLEFGGYRVNITPSGCSIFAGKDFMVRNYDYHPKTYDGRYVVFEPSDGGFSTIGLSQKITGRCDGMNEKGLMIGYTFMNRKRPGSGFICHMIGRMILERCANTEEAVNLLKEIPHRGSFSYVLFDRRKETPYIVETSPRRVEVREGYSCTNHFEILTEENRHILNDSKKRLEIIEEHQVNSLGGSEAFRLFNDTNAGVFSKLYGSWAGTIHTSAYFPNDMEAWISLGGDQKPTKLNFSSWLKGLDYRMERIEGNIDTDIPFVNMEKADWYR